MGQTKDLYRWPPRRDFSGISNRHLISAAKRLSERLVEWRPTLRFGRWPPGTTIFALAMASRLQTRVGRLLAYKTY